MSSKARALDAVKVGDVVFGIAEGGQNKLLLVYEVDDSGFWGRHVTSQTTAKFARDGQSLWVHDGGSCTIVSTAALPAEQYEVAIGLDRKMRTGKAHPDFVLSEAEIRLILTHKGFFKARLLPGTEAIVKAADKLNAVRSILQMEWDPLDAAENPPVWDEYLNDLPALVDLLDRPGSVDEVTDFLTGMASRRARLREVGERSRGAAESLLRLRENWT